MRLLSIHSARVKLILLSIMHMVTDGLCAYLVFVRLYPDNPAFSFYVFAGYNLLAFVTQSPVGSLIDKYNRPKLFLAISIFAMLLGYLCSKIWWLAVLLIGMSNSIFHVAGGKYVSDKSGNDISHLGIFVSTGAVGLVIGQRYTDIVALPYIMFALLIICGLVFILLEDGETISYHEEYVGKADPSYILLAVLGVVLIRAFIGKVITPDFTLEGHIFLLISIATALGKAMGGICSKLIGIRPTTYISMSLAALCLTLGLGNPYTFILGIFAFNFSMPITLYYANILMKGKEGFAFGTLAAVLVPGYFLAMSFTYDTAMRIASAIMCLTSIAVIIYISRRISADVPTVGPDNNP